MQMDVPSCVPRCASLFSKRMHFLGITDDAGIVPDDYHRRRCGARLMFYSGDAKPEPGAIVCRVSPSFIRFGNFELPASRGDTELLGQLVAFCIDRDFPHLKDRGENRIYRLVSGSL